VRIHIIVERNTPGKEDILKSKNMLPRGFLPHEPVIEKEPTIIIQTGVFPQSNLIAVNI